MPSDSLAVYYYLFFTFLKIQNLWNEASKVNETGLLKDKLQKNCLILIIVQKKNKKGTNNHEEGIC